MFFQRVNGYANIFRVFIPGAFLLYLTVDITLKRLIEYIDREKYDDESILHSIIF
jgi:hypothetical protein